MELITTAIALELSKQAINPIIKSIEKEYGEKTKELLKAGIKKVLQKFSLKKEEVVLIETEIVEANTSILTDENKFLEFFENNNKIQELMRKIEKREPNINIVIEKSYNEFLIDGNNNSITF